MSAQLKLKTVSARSALSLKKGENSFRFLPTSPETENSFRLYCMETKNRFLFSNIYFRRKLKTVSV